MNAGINPVRPAPTNDEAAQAAAAYHEALGFADFLRETDFHDLHGQLVVAFPSISRSGVLFGISLAWTHMRGVLALAAREQIVSELELRAVRAELAALKEAMHGK